jgi:Uma2 family endonuclease
MSVTTYRFSVDEYHRLGETGILGEDDRVELLEGELIVMSPIGRRHAAAVMKLIKLFSRRLDDRCIVDPQNPVIINGFSEPQPDLTLARPVPDFYASGHPRPEDIFLIVEVAESSLHYDRDKKVPIYARFEIAEVWNVNLVDDVIEQYRAPFAGGYAEVRQFRRGEQISVARFPDVRFEVNEILP